MPSRPRYPSDDARLRSRPHVKLHLTVSNHPRYAEVFADPEMRGVIWALWVVAYRSHAAKTDDHVTLTSADLVWISGRTQFKSALNLLRVCCERMGYSLKVDGRCVTVHVRNFAKKQGLDSAARGVDAEHSADSASLRMQNTEADTEAEEEPPVVPQTPNGVPVASAWAKGLEAAQGYRPAAARWELTAARRKALSTLLHERPALGADAFAACVHGYFARHRRPGPGFDPMQHFDCDTLLRASKRSGYVEAYEAALAEGRAPPFAVEREERGDRLREERRTVAQRVLSDRTRRDEARGQ